MISKLKLWLRTPTTNGWIVLIVIALVLSMVFMALAANAKLPQGYSEKATCLKKWNKTAKDLEARYMIEQYCLRYVDHPELEE